MKGQPLFRISSMIINIIVKSPFLYINKEDFFIFSDYIRISILFLLNNHSFQNCVGGCWNWSQPSPARSGNTPCTDIKFITGHTHTHTSTKKQFGDSNQPNVHVLYCFFHRTATVQQLRDSVVISHIKSILSGVVVH